MVGTLSRAQFQILNTLRCTDAVPTQRQLAERTEFSLGTINAHLRDLETQGLLAHGTLTEAGLQALAPYKVDNAVIMAAGLSRRFAPISYERPKGTLKVRGEVLIERQIEQLHEAGIRDISVVVGYKKEYFFYLAKKYGVRIVINEDYLTRNNNGSLWQVKEQLGNTFICSSDDYFTDNPFELYVYKAYYSAQYAEGKTAEWCITTAKSGRITGVSVGGSDAWFMLGHVYFDRDFSTRFVEILEQVYDLPETEGKLWESIYVDHIKDFDMEIRKYPAGVINEFDSVDEIRSFDPLFMENVDSEVFDTISQALGCSRSDITDFSPLKQGITNLSCHFAVGEEEYVYRHPGIGTDKLINRQAELEALTLANQLGLDDTFLAGDAAKGWKISRFVRDARNLDVTSDEELQRAMEMARTLHDCGHTLPRNFDFVSEGLRYEFMLTELGPIDVPGYQELREKVMQLREYAQADGFPTGPSHNDFFPLNFLVTPSGALELIDWEYAGMSDIASDFGTMVVCTQMTPQRAEQAMTYYFGRTPTPQEQRHFWAYVVFAGWCWYVWSLLKEAEGDDVGEWLFIYYSHAVEYVDGVLTSYREEAAPVLSPISLSPRS